MIENVKKKKTKRGWTKGENPPDSYARPTCSVRGVASYVSSSFRHPAPAGDRTRRGAATRERIISIFAFVLRGTIKKTPCRVHELHHHLVEASSQSCDDYVGRAMAQADHASAEATHTKTSNAHDLG